MKLIVKIAAFVCLSSMLQVGAVFNKNNKHTFVPLDPKKKTLPGKMLSQMEGIKDLFSRRRDENVVIKRRDYSHDGLVNAEIREFWKATGNNE